MTRRHVLTALAVVGFITAPIDAADDTLAENQSRFGEVTGTVQVLSQGSAQWIDAHIDLPLETGDQILVGEDGSAELSLSKDVLLLLDHDTDVAVGRITTQEGRITLKRGVLTGKVEASNGIAGNWDFETPLGVCGVRGTEFMIVHSDEEGTHLGVFRGAVQMTPADSATGSFPPEVVNAHEEGVLEKRKAPRKLKNYSPVLRPYFGRMTRLQKRFPQFAGVWVPMTPAYRTELRRRFVAPVKPHTRVRRPPPSRRPRPGPGPRH